MFTSSTPPPPLPSLLYPLPSPSNPLKTVSPSSIMAALLSLSANPPPPSGDPTLHLQLLTTLSSLSPANDSFHAALLPPLLSYLSLHSLSHLPALLPQFMEGLYLILPALLRHHLGSSDITPFLARLIPPLISAPFSPPPRSRLLRHMPPSPSIPASLAALTDSVPPLPPDVQVFLLLLTHPHVPLVPQPRSDVVARFVASVHPATGAEYGRCGRSDGGICLPGLLQNAAVAASSSPSDRGVARQFATYLSSFLAGDGIMVQSVILTDATVGVFVKEILEQVGGSNGAGVNHARVLALVQSAVDLPSFASIPPASASRLTKYIIKSPLASVLAKLLDSPTFSLSSPEFSALLSWSYALFFLPPRADQPSCVRIQNLLLHHLLPAASSSASSPAEALAAADVLMRTAAALGAVDAALMAVTVGALGPFLEGSEAVAKKREIVRFLGTVGEGRWKGGSYSEAVVAGIAAAFDEEELLRLLASPEREMRDTGLAVKVHKAAGGGESEGGGGGGEGGEEEGGEWAEVLEAMRQWR